MDSALLEILRDIPKQEIDRALQADGFSRWTYFTDAEAGEAGVIYANDSSLALYYPSPDKMLKPGPLGVMELKSLRYVPSAHQLYVVHSGQYLTLQVFNDIGRAGEDKTTPQQWQQFLIDHSVPQMTARATSKVGSNSSRRTLILAGVIMASAVLVAAIVFLQLNSK